MDKGTVGVIGAGAMGRGIAQVSAAVGYDVILNDVDMGVVESSLERLERDLARLVEKGKLDAAERDMQLSRVRASADLRDMADADIVVEAIYENLDAKKKVFATLDEICGENVILGSNSSSLSILDMAMATKRPENVVGIHFFNPVPLMKGVELVCTIMTSFQTLEGARQFSESLGKETWVAKDAPGFLSTRLLIPYLLDAMRLLENGFASKEDIDTCCKASFNCWMRRSSSTAQLSQTRVMRFRSTLSPRKRAKVAWSTAATEKMDAMSSQFSAPKRVDRQRS